VSGDRGRRGGQRGATLTLFAFVTGTVLVVVGASLMDALTNTYRMSALRERQARARAIAEAGVTEAVAGLERARLEPALRVEREGRGDLGGGAYAYAIEEEGAGAYVVRSEATLGEGPDRVHVKLRAAVRRGVGVDARFRAVAVARE